MFHALLFDFDFGFFSCLIGAATAILAMFNELLFCFVCSVVCP